MDVVARLRAELGDAVVVGGDEFDATRSDGSGWRSPGSPLALVRARTVAEVQATLRLAHESGTPVVTRGAGTGLAGGAVATEGSIVLSLADMNRILEIDPANQLARVQPGVINAELDSALEPYGLWYAPDPASKAISTIGGNIATNAGGLLCAKYGVTREAVLGLTVVLADGRLLRTGHSTVKGVTGYDLTALIVGSEGTLGVVVEATVRALPRPVGATVTFAAFYPSVTDAALAASTVTAAGLRPAVLELLDEQALEAIGAYLGEAELDAAMGETRGGGFLLAQFDEDPSETVLARAQAVLAGGASGPVRRTSDPGTAARLLAIRRAFHPALEARGEVLIEDVSVPRSRLAEAFDAIAEISARHGVAIPTAAHAADGNLHPNFVIDSPDGGVPQAVWDAAHDLFRTALALGGTLTGEHGVGVLKRHHLREEIGDDSYELQRSLKAVFDPRGILNPGKVFEP